MSPNDPLPIFLTSLYLPPTMNSDLALEELAIATKSSLLAAGITLFVLTLGLYKSYLIA